jgi:hypothetical protein
VSGPVTIPPRSSPTLIATGVDLELAAIRSQRDRGVGCTANQRRRYLGAVDEVLPASDPGAGASDRSRRRCHAGLKLGLVRGGEEGDDEG